MGAVAKTLKKTMWDGMTQKLIVQPVKPNQNTSREQDQHQVQEQVRQLQSQQQTQQQLLALVSHEIKTPIGAIMAMAELLKNTDLNDPQSHYVNTLSFAAENLVRATQDMLTFARHDTDHLNFDHKPVELIPFLSSLAVSIAPQAQAKGLNFQAQMSPDLPSKVITDPHRLSQVINNLANNALKYTNEGAIELSVTGQNLQSDEWTISIQIKDTGIGISKAEQDHIFEPFVQANNVVEKAVPGSGLGLWIANQIAKGLNGELTCHSEPNSGSTFVLNFTCKADQEEESETAPAPNLQTQTESPKPEAESPSEQQATPGKKQDDFSALKGHVLVVEDNKLNQMLIKIYLDKFGLSFECVDNGYVALSEVEQNKYDLILMDIMMPVLDGVVTTKQLHELWQEQNQEGIPIIAFSASASPENVKQYKQVGINDIVAKPIDSQVLYTVLEKYLTKDETKPIQKTQSQQTG